MNSRRSRIWLAISVVNLSICRLIEAKTGPLSVTPSTNWYGDAGSWSAVSIKIGDPVQDLDVMVSTASSEILVVASTACSNNECAADRGGTFDSTQSKTWSAQGVASLNLDAMLGDDVSGLVGTDTLAYGTSGISVPNALVASFNSSVFPLGFIGLGISSSTSTTFSTSGGANGKPVSTSAPISPISQLVETMSVIPSHSYGYTAGASYRNADGCPNSLTLGGRDTHRYVGNNVSFQLSTQQQPSIYINSLHLSVPHGTSLPANWESSSLPMIEPSQAVTVLIDSTTPYLWLPESVCESFAAALNLTYNSTLNLYTFDGNVAQHSALQTLNFTVSLELSAEASSTETITIELPYQAFDQEMVYPETKFYFPLKQAANESQYTLGRTVLQEAYIIVDYERGNFSIHQALFPANASTDISGIVVISRPADSSFAGPDDHAGGGMSKAAIAGIVVSSLALLVLLIVANVYRIRYNHLKALQDAHLGYEKPFSKKDLVLAKLRIGNPRSRKSTVGPRATIYETEGTSAFPAEIGATTNERFELPAPITPVELDGGTAATQVPCNDKQGSQSSEYERERMRQQLAMRRGPMDDDSSFPDKTVMYTHEGGTYINDSNRVSALSSIATNSGGLLSPVSELRDPPPCYQRQAPTIIPEGTKVVFASKMPQHSSPGMEVGFLPDSRDSRTDLGGFMRPSVMFSGGDGNRSTLGSNYTVEEARTLERLRELEGEREYEAMMIPGRARMSLENQGLVPSPQRETHRRFSWQPDP